MKNQALFSSKDKSKKLKCRLLQFLFGALRVNNIYFRDIGFDIGFDKTVYTCTLTEIFHSYLQQVRIDYCFNALSFFVRVSQFHFLSHYFELAILNHATCLSHH